MTEDTRIRNISRQIQRPTPEELPAGSAASLETVMAQRGDRYTPHLLNRITQALNAMLRHRTTPVSDVVLRAEQGIPQEVSENRQNELSLFERVFLAHFEGGARLGENLPAGVSKFLLKSPGEWVSFFQKFLPFTFQKTGRLADLQSVIFRGLFQEAAEPVLLISDLQFLNGKMDKFARLKIQSAEMMQPLAKTMPGDVLAMALVSKLLQSPEFSYLALSHRIMNPEMVEKGDSDIARAYQSPEQMKDNLLREGIRNVSQGIALSARTEQLMAEKLDLKVGRRKQKSKDPFEGSSSGDGGVFVPWFQREKKKFSGKPRWWVPFIYLISSSAVLLAIYSILKLMK